MSQPAAESRASLLTSPQRGAVAVIAARGPAAAAAVEAHFRAANARPVSNQRPGAVIFGRWHEDSTASESSAEDVVVCPLVDGAIEIHCHGGVAATSRVLAALGKAGCEIVPWSRWAAAEERSETEAEAAIALAAAGTRRVAAILLDQYSGALSGAIAELERLAAKGEVEAGKQRLVELRRWMSFGLRLTRPWKAAIVGKPNVGKSSLMNAILGRERSIVFDRPGTTRDVLSAVAAIDGWPVELTDTAGIRDSACSLESQGVELARQQIQSADLVMWVMDARDFPSVRVDEIAAAALRELSEVGGKFSIDAAGDESRVIVVVNKMDLVSEAAPNMPGRQSCGVHANIAFTSATQGAGIGELMARLLQLLVPEAPLRGAAVPFTQRHAARLEELAALLQVRP